MIYFGTRINPRYLKRIDLENDKLFLFNREGDNFDLLTGYDVILLGGLTLRFSFKNILRIARKSKKFLRGYNNIYVFELFPFLFGGRFIWKRTHTLEVGDLLHLNWPLSRFTGIFLVYIIERYSIQLVVTSAGFRHYFERMGVTRIKLIENIHRVNSLPDIHYATSPLRIGYIGMFRYLANWDYILSLLSESDVQWVMFGQFLQESEAVKYSNYRGVFDKSNLSRVYANIDIVFCYYSGANEKYLLPNKLFEAILYGKPIIYSAYNFYSDVIQENGLGVCLNGNEKHDRNLLIDLVNNYAKYMANIEEYRLTHKRIFLNDV